VRKDIRLGGVVGMYQLLSSRLVSVADISSHISNVVVEELFTTLASFEQQETLYLVAVLELIGYLGPSDRSIMRLPVLKSMVSEPALEHVQKNVICTMLQLGYEGLCAAVDVGTKDINGSQAPILKCILSLRAV
jgi:hypothetical protein